MALNPHLPRVQSLSGIGIMPISNPLRSSISSSKNQGLLTILESPWIEKSPPTILNLIPENCFDKQMNVSLLDFRKSNVVALPIQPITILSLGLLVSGQYLYVSMGVGTTTTAGL